MWKAEKHISVLLFSEPERLLFHVIQSILSWLSLPDCAKMTAHVIPDVYLRRNPSHWAPTTWSAVLRWGHSYTRDTVFPQQITVTCAQQCACVETLNKGLISACSYVTSMPFYHFHCLLLKCDKLTLQSQRSRCPNVTHKENPTTPLGFIWDE